MDSGSRDQPLATARNGLRFAPPLMLGVSPTCQPNMSQRPLQNPDMRRVPRDVAATDGIRCGMYSCESGSPPVAYTNMIRLKQPAAELLSRLRRP